MSPSRCVILRHRDSLMVFLLPVVVVLAVSPIVFNALILGGIAVSAIWGRHLVLHVREMT